jgi:hypothetical protein
MMAKPLNLFISVFWARWRAAHKSSLFHVEHPEHFVQSFYRPLAARKQVLVHGQHHDNNSSDYSRSPRRRLLPEAAVEHIPG